ncbi:MAG: type VI secretion system baseplate subunit TssE [Planctomycetaceae bacterium]|nr:type VI secretion system baseplate subunit TssE [Planctomycetaceae bacterium]
MPPFDEEQLLVPSVLDRLIDENPRAATEIAPTRSQALREAKNSVRRDLENLLNTKRRFAVWPQEWEDLESSLANYGVPDFSGPSFAGPTGRKALCRVLQEVIHRFEPRFRSVVVELLDENNQNRRSLRFRVKALLDVYPAPEVISFDSRLEPNTRTITVEGMDV